MKSLNVLFLSAAILILCFVVAGTADPSLMANGVQRVAWLLQNFSKDQVPPFSFNYDGKNSNDFIKSWKFHQEQKALDAARTEYTFTYVDLKTGLEVKCLCTVFADYPAIEWLLKFKNTSTKNTPILEEINTAVSNFHYPDAQKFMLHYASGSTAQKNDFAPNDKPLKPKEAIVLQTSAGRSSEAYLPFFNMDAETQGIMAALGWSGQWKASFQLDANNGIDFSAGFKKVHFTLLPDETIRTPRVLLLFWQGKDRMAGHNLLRQFILKYHTPQKDGKPVTLPLAASVCGGGPSPCNENTCTTEEYAIAMAKRLHQFGLKFDIFWIDAGWYSPYNESWSRGVGNWRPDPDKYPNGLRPVTDTARKLGMKFILWFEPERVFKGTIIDKEHPEWVLRRQNENDNGLFHLGDPQACHWLTDLISGEIDKEGVDLYRQDFNMDPLPYWQQNDTPDRQGISEIKHIENLYAFWDELLARHPGLFIDNCSSGGRRIDLETISRSAPLWRTDYSYFESTGYQCHTYGINFYLPCSGTGNMNPNAYEFRSALSSALVTGWLLNDGNFSLEKARRDIEEYKKVQLYFYGDYYPLTNYDTGNSVWMAYQFEKPTSKDGIVLAFRRPSCTTSTLKINLKNLEAKKLYEVRYEDSNLSFQQSGEKLMNEGLELKIAEAPGSLLITYDQVNK